MSPLWKSPCHSICAAQIRGIICCTVRCAYKVNASSSAATNDKRRRARRQECHTDKMYSSRPHPRVAIPAAQQQQNGLARRNTQHRSPFPSWLPAPEEGEQQERVHRWLAGGRPGGRRAARRRRSGASGRQAGVMLGWRGVPPCAVGYALRGVPSSRPEEHHVNGRAHAERHGGRSLQDGGHSP